MAVDAIVIGGGHNGLVAAWYLARAGHAVCLVEARSIVGGACATEELWPGHLFSTCASILYQLQPGIIEDMGLVSRGLNVIPPEPGVVALYPNGRAIVGWRDAGRFRDSVATVSAHDAEVLPRFNEQRRALVDILHRSFLKAPPTLDELVRASRRRGDLALLDRLLFGRASEFLDSFFDSDLVKGFFVAAGDVGDPDAPGSLLGMVHGWHGMRSPARFVGFPQGGMGAVTRAMANAVEAVGVELITGVPATRIAMSAGSATHVELADGRVIHGSVVVSTIDPKSTFRLVADPGAERHRADVLRRSTRAASLKVHATLKGLPDYRPYLGDRIDPGVVSYIRICPAIDYLRRSWHDASLGRLSRFPVMSILIPSVLDDTLAPAGRHTLSIWVRYAPAGLTPAAWEALRDEGIQAVLGAITEYLPDLPGLIDEIQLFTPADLEARIGLTDGNIRHLDMIPGQMFADRPLPGWGYATPIPGLFLAGAGTHPGGEVSGAPGHNGAAAAIEYLARNRRLFTKQGTPT